METDRSVTDPWDTWLDELGKDVEEHETGESDPDDTKEDYHVADSEYNTDSDAEVYEEDKPDIDTCQVSFEGKDGKTVWTSKPTALDSKLSNKVPHRPKIKGKGKNTRTFLESFSCIIDDNIIRLITNYTNINIKKVMPNFAKPSDAVPTTEVEIAALLGLIYLIGLKNPGRGNIEDLWDQHGVGMEAFYLTMSYRRYRLLIACLGFHDPQDLSMRSDLDKLAPLREILQIFLHNCQNSFLPGEVVTIDDLLVEYQGKCPFRQYVPEKRRSGIRLFLLVDVKTMYTHNVEIVINNQSESLYNAATGPSDIAKILIMPIAGSYRNVTFDSRFTDVKLALDLQKHYQVNCIGLISKNKQELPIQFVKQRRHGEGSLIGFLKDEKCALISHQEAGEINLYLSTRQQEIFFDKPEREITLYNETKQAFSELTRMCTTYSVVRTCHRWPLAIFFHLLNIAAINGITIYKANNPEAMITRTEYLKGLALELIKPHMTERSHQDYTRKIIKMKMNYFLRIKKEDIPPPKRAPTTTGRCSVCPRKRDRKTRNVCNLCHKLICKDHHVIVCTECFEDPEPISSEEDD